jgi:hypothetical protein
MPAIYQSEVVVVLVERHQIKLLFPSPWCLCQVVETGLVVDVATKYSCNCTKDCIFKVWTLNCRLLAWQLST